MEPWPNHQTEHENQVALERFWDRQFTPTRDPAPVLPPVNREFAWALTRSMLVRAGHLERDQLLLDTRAQPDVQHLLEIANNEYEFPEAYRGHPQALELAWPSFDELAHYEICQVDRTCTELMDGPLRALRTLVGEGMSHEHANWLIRISKRWLTDQYTATPEEERAMFRARLDDAAVRAKEAMDIRAELIAIKTGALISGVTKAPASDENFEIAEIVTEQSELDGDPLDQLPGPSAPAPGEPDDPSDP